MMQKTACISADDVYRYRLGRIWKPNAPACLFIMLNPSTADAYVDDATIRRCLDYAASRMSELCTKTQEPAGSHPRNTAAG